jgi:hypothetical protein
VQSVARGIIAADGLPMEFPTISLGESFLNPTAMVYRNLMAMEVVGPHSRWKRRYWSAAATRPCRPS